MQFSISQPDLLQALNMVLPAVATRSTLPVLANVCLEAEGDTLRFGGMNLAMAISLAVPATIAEPGAVTLPARLLLDLVKAFPKERVDVAIHPRTLTATVKCAGYSANVKGIDASEYPTIARFPAESPCLSLPAATAQRLIQLTAFAAATNDSRAVLNGIDTWVQNGDRLALAATDGLRLATASIALPAPAEPLRVVIPAAAYLHLERLLAGQPWPEETRLQMVYHAERGQVQFQLGAIALSAQVIAAPFPDYRTIIEQALKDVQNEATADVTALRQALHMATLFADATSHRVTVAFDPAASVLRITSSGDDGDQLAVVAAEAMTGKASALNLNGRFWGQALKAMMDSPVLLQNKHVHRPLVLSPAAPNGIAYMALIMPMGEK